MIDTEMEGFKDMLVVCHTDVPRGTSSGDAVPILKWKACLHMQASSVKAYCQQL